MGKVEVVSWSNALFKVTIQPDITKGFTHLGTTSKNMTLDEEETAGVLLMAYNIFGPNWFKHIKVELSTGSPGIIYTDRNLLALYSPAYLEFKPEDYSKRLIILFNGILPFGENNEEWIKYIYRLGEVKGRLPNEVIMQYTCRLLNKGNKTTMIVQFLDNGFINGAISVCDWFNLNWKDYMDNLHLGDALQYINE